MDQIKLTLKNHPSLVAAHQIAKYYLSQKVTTLPLMVALNRGPDSAVVQLLNSIKVNLPELGDKLVKVAYKLSKIRASEEPSPSSQLRQVIINAFNQAKRLKDGYIRLDICFWHSS